MAEKRQNQNPGVPGNANMSRGNMFRSFVFGLLIVCIVAMVVAHNNRRYICHDRATVGITEWNYNP